MHWADDNPAGPNQMKHGLHAIDGRGTSCMFHHAGVDFCRVHIQPEYFDEDRLDDLKAAYHALGNSTAGRCELDRSVTVVEHQPRLFQFFQNGGNRACRYA